MTGALVYRTLKVLVKNRVATIQLARPDVRNAFDPTMIRELTTLFMEINSRNDLVAVVLRGEGKSFCSGADLGYMKSMAKFTFEENQKDAQLLFAMFSTIRACPHPVLGFLHGHVMGGGLGLAVLCDISGAVLGTQFCFSEVKLGLVPAVISPFVFEKMAPGLTRQFMLSAEVFGAEAAEAAGLVQFVGSEIEVEKFIELAIERIQKNGPEAVRATKNLIRAVAEMNDWNKLRDLTTKTISERRVSDEGQEGLKSFLEKRNPDWWPQ